MTEPKIKSELVARHNLTPDGPAHISLVRHPQRACEPLVGSDDSKWIFESIFAALENKHVAQTA